MMSLITLTEKAEALETELSEQNVQMRSWIDKRAKGKKDGFYLGIH